MVLSNAPGPTDRPAASWALWFLHACGGRCAEADLLPSCVLRRLSRNRNLPCSFLTPSGARLANAIGLILRNDLSPPEGGRREPITYCQQDMRALFLCGETQFLCA